jgi:hypothetical protein
VIVATLDLLARFVAIANEADVAPAGTMTPLGTDASDELVPSVTAAPPAGATPVNVTVPVAGLPPLISEGVITSQASFAGGAVWGEAGSSLNSVPSPRAPPTIVDP